MSENAKKMRKLPTQKRSRERVENILKAACELIAAQGSDAMKMGELAEKAGVPIGSLYQYFPDKASIIHALADRYNEDSQHCIEEALAGVTSARDLIAAFDQLIDTYYELFLAEPVICDIWTGTQADKTLRDMELEVSRANAALLTKTVLRIRNNDGDAGKLAARCLLIMYNGEATMRLAVSVPAREGREIVASYKRMIRREFEEMLRV
ncbi:TetR family transcriptional regulator [Thalassospira profundimaris]|uniref:TetR family transcriptional regulator n=2 Tax=Thalassospira TaxID=168934 RepID=A0A367VZ81_9PROT|nr:TetR family transcriptional regulator [Thalassospira profundimaris]